MPATLADLTPRLDLSGWLTRVDGCGLLLDLIGWHQREAQATGSLLRRVNVCSALQRRIVGVRHQGRYTSTCAGTRVARNGRHQSILGFSA